MKGGIIGVIKEKTRSLEDSSHVLTLGRGVHNHPWLPGAAFKII